ncbi:MAG: OmpA family protein, partial [Campylobacterota bacterium]
PLVSAVKGASESDMNVADVETPAHAPQVPREPEPEVRPVAVAAPKVQEPKPQSAPEAPRAEVKPVAPSVAPAAYFRNFQLFENRSVVALNEEGKARLNEWVRQFRAGGYQSVVINAYTDSIPPQRLKHLYATNEILSAARGKVVADYLVSQGIDASRVSVNGKGALDPVASNDTEEGRSKNRRIEFVLR